MSTAPRPNTTSQRAPRKKSSNPPPRELRLIHLPQIIFDRISNEFDVLHEASTEFYWRKVSIFRHPEVSRLSLPYTALVKKLAIPGASFATWISYCEGFVTNSFCLLISEHALHPDSKQFRFELKPILIIEAGHRIPVQEQGADYRLDETADFEKIRNPRFLEIKPQRIIELQRRILSIFRRQVDALPRRPRRNPLYDPI